MRSPDRLFPADAGLKAIARGLYDTVRAEPLFSAHGHVDADLLVRNEPFRNPSELLVTADHYVTRLLHSLGIPLERLGLDGDVDPREVWQLFCDHWYAFLGTPSRYWIEGELATLFGVDEPLGPQNATAVYDSIAARLSRPEYLPRSLFDSFGIDTIATTDDPLSDLEAHRVLAQDGVLEGSVIPNFRPDRFVDPAEDGWRQRVEALGDVTGLDTTGYRKFLDALRARREFFVSRGATATDHAMLDVGSEPLDDADAGRLHEAGLRGTLTAAESAAYRRNLTFQMAAMSVDDGLVMQIHPGVLRNHHAPTAARFGSDTGHDIPVPISYTAGLRPLLEAFGTDPHFRLVLYTVDEAAYSREIAPLAGFYPAVYMGVPWWFLDAPDAMLRFRSAVTETAGFYKSAGFVDDTRAFCSIPERHDMARRVEASFLARLVGEHRLTEDQAATIIRDLVTLPRRVFARTR